MRQRILALAAAAVALGTVGISPAAAHNGHEGTHGSQGTDGSQGSHSSQGSHGNHGSAQGGYGDTTPKTPARGPQVFLAATLSGAEEVPVAGGPAVGDADGKADALVRVKGDRVTFALRWKGIGAPTLGHIHQGKAGANGDVKVPLFGTAMPDTVHSAAGQTTVTDAALAQQIRTDPAGFYVNLHSKEFPGGAVRGQLQPLHKPVNPLDILKGGKLLALSDGGQEVPKDDASKVGDPDGHAITFIHPKGSAVDYSFAWVNIAPPSLGHIHKGRFGKNGDIQFNFFNNPVPQNIFAVSGTLENQDPKVVDRVRRNPSDYYSNLHTAEFPDGAVRGQLFH
ncbi:CHRD domain-containing protein [Streptomyces sp. NPDC004647]|uniref:CHRD domain-containing protein n=1 Tax=Streptomyces sp. NPDC004647 TaxID=3154671 RepID=UPI0033BBB6D9